MNNINEELIEFAKSGNLKKVKECLNNGADIDHKNINGETALMWASWRGHLEVGEFLIENGANSVGLWRDRVFRNSYQQ
mgnify:CR=1 FL=1